MQKESLINARRLSVIGLKNELVNLVLILLSVISIPALIASLTRISLLGFLPIMGVHIILVSIIIGVTLFRNHVSLIVRSSTIVGTLFLIGIGGLLSFGISGNGFPFLIVAILFSTILFSKRHGLIVFLASAIVVLIILIAIYSGYLTLQMNIEEYVYSTSSLTTFFTSFVFLGVVIVVVLGRFNNFFSIWLKT